MLLDEPAVAEPPALPRTPLRLGLVAAAIGLAAVAVHAVTVLQGYFWQDDFVIVQRAAAAAPYDPAYLFQDYNGHLAPGMFLLAWLVTAIAPLSHALAAVPLLVAHAGALLAFWRLLVGCFGARRALLVPFTLFALSPIVLFTTLWWAFAIQMTPLLLAMAATLDCHVRYLRTRRLGYAVGAVLWLLLGLAFYEKAILVPALLFAVTVLLGSGPVAAFTAHRRLWLAYGLLIVLYAVVYLSATSSPPAPPQTEVPDTAEYVRRALLDTFLPGLFGGPWPASATGMTWPEPAMAVRIAVAVAALALLVGGIVVSRKRAALAWLALGGYLAVDLTLVALNRLPQFGVLIGNDPRFLADAVPVAVLMGAFAFLPPAGRPGRVRGDAPVTALTAMVALSAVFSVFSLAPAVRFEEGRAYVAAVRGALAADPDLPVYDARVPEHMMVAWGFGQEALLSRFTPLLAVGARFDEPAESVYLVDGAGTPKKVEHLRWTVDGEPGPVKDCGYAVTGEVVGVPLATPVRGKHVLRIGYYTADAGELAVTAAGVEQLVRVEAGVHRIDLVVSGSFSRVDLRRTTPGSPVCAVTVQVGQPWVG
ncbi:hypothetical protein ACFQV2_03135 [Actinokineospora soli]|uniref:4-amino-4-deoxy-L-arabinose transferase n=1 Tax=Actinokineospora soli TaxID=1048753 RepID=A0ABW2TGA9_9PSEU